MKWRIVALTDICRPRQWKTIPTSVLTEKGYPVFGANGIIGFYSEYNHEKPTVVITCRGATCGTVGITLPKSYITGNAMALDDLNEDQVDQKFLYYQLSRRGFRDVISGSAQPQITGQGLSTVKVNLPPLPEQKRIAAILDKADEIRRKREKAIELTDSFLRSVFLEMFGDPEINPHNFKRGTIRDLVSEVKYGTSGKAGALGSFEILRMNNLTYSGDMDLSDIKRIDIDSKDESKYLVRKGDLLFNRTNSKELVGKTAVYPFDEVRAIAGYLIRVRPNTNANTEYISGYLNSTHGKKTLRHMCKSIVGMANINAQELQDISILLPPIELQNRYADLVGAVRALRRKLNNSLADMELLESSLSHRLFTNKPDTVRGTGALMEVAHAL